MKLIIQIPCYNESETLNIALGALPREVSGFDTVEWLIINDGSTDNTIKVAKEYGVDHIVNSLCIQVFQHRTAGLEELEVVPIVCEPVEVDHGAVAEVAELARVPGSQACVER